MSSIRLLLTNDFFGSFAAQATSWGKQPGGSAVRATVERLRQGAAASAWIDVGDFSGGGPLAPATGGLLSWAAASELGFDAAIPGNHEFDYGDEPVLEWAPRLPFPLVAADPSLAALSASFQSYHTVSAPDGRTVAVIGISLAERRGPAVWERLGDLDVAARLTIDTARRLRGRADHIVVAIHEGVPRQVAPGEPAGGHRMHAFCAAVRGHVEAVLGAHTLAHHIGPIAGVPYIQPWAMGVEVGVLEIDDAGVHLDSVRVIPPPDGELGWQGAGSGTLADLGSQIVSELHRPLASPAMAGADPLGDAVAEGLLGLLGADVALTTRAEVGCGQLPLDDVETYIPAGSVSEADLLRALPWPAGTRGDETWAADLSADEVGLLSRSLDIGMAPDQPCFRALRTPGRVAGRTVLSSNYIRNARALLRREADWQPTGVGLRDALRAFLARGQHRDY